jgi:hypothetical protein
MSEKTVLEIGIYVAIVAFLLTVIALVDTMSNDNLEGISFQNKNVIEQREG